MSAITAAERKRLAEQLGLSEQYLYQCLTGRRDMDPAAAMKAETDSHGALKRQMLCQSTYRAIWPDLPDLPDLSPVLETEKARA
jgi:DNA-binding transcriptional regulator YdaS (Cro superfamily)